MTLTRRDWMLASLCWTEALRAQSRTQFAWFHPDTASEIKAIAAQIIPDDDTPGADGAGVIWFIDGALAGYDQDKRDLYIQGLKEAQVRRLELFPGSTSIASLSSDQQVQLLNAIESTEFFQQVRQHTILGFFGHPKYGGNRDRAGWKLIGVEYSMRYQPPFGYYDAEPGADGQK